MKKLLKFAGIAALVLAAILLVNTFRHGAAPRATPRALRHDSLHDVPIAEHLSHAIRFRTVSHQDPKDDDRTTFAALRGYLEETYPKTHATLTRELVNGDAMLFRWAGTDSSLAPVLVMGHQDVVPVEAGTEKNWTHPPFDGVIADGFVWGRGAMDDKGSLICLLEAIESLVDEGFKPARTIYLASGFDEEVGGHEGSHAIAELLQKRGVKLDWVLDEGMAVTTGIVPGVSRPVAFIAVTEKGYLTVELVAHAEGGHSSMPGPETSVGILAAGIDRLQRTQMPPRLLPFLATDFAAFAPEMDFGKRVFLSNLWLTTAPFVHAMVGAKETNAMVRTTTAPTMLDAGVKENVLPSSARAIVNFRLLPGDSIDAVMAHVKATLADERITATKMERTLSEPSPISSDSSEGYRVLARVTGDFFPDAIVVPGMVVGATDSRHFQPIAKDVYRYVPRILAKDELKRIHGTDERADIPGLLSTTRAYRAILVDGAGPAK